MAATYDDIINDYPENSFFTLEASEPEAGYLDPMTLADNLVRHTGVNIFLTGKAGTGKTTFLHSLKSNMRKRMVVLGPTGVAAINAGGSTIHSFFQLSFAPFIPGKGFVGEAEKKYGFSKSKRRIIRTLDLLVIDEISMVRPDVMDAIDDVLRRFRNPSKPFGGVQLLLIGDLRQLSPVTQPQEWNILSQYYSSPYFFHSQALAKAGFVTVELSKVYRQQDSTFVDILNKIRDNRADSDTLAILNRRADPSIFPREEEGVIRLTTHNASADRINRSKLDNLDRDLFEYKARITGNFPQSSFPAEETLQLKTGAQVMFIKNDPGPQKEFYNGLIGTVSSLSPDTVYVTTHEEPPRELEVKMQVWENMKYSLNESTGEITENVEGTFSQIPLRLAWAITIHKSQGLTFDRAIIDATRSFAPGQTYVALSRCRSIEGLYLDAPLPPSAIMTDGIVSRFIDTQKHRVPDAATVDYFRKTYNATLVHELFDFRRIYATLDSLVRIFESELSSFFPTFVNHSVELRHRAESTLIPVVEKLHQLLDKVLPHMGNSEADTLCHRKVTGGCAYFVGMLDEIEKMVKNMPTTIDNEAILRRLLRVSEELLESTAISKTLLQYFASNPFDADAYNARKAAAILSFENVSPTTAPTKTRSRKRASERTFGIASDDIRNPELYTKLRNWRTKIAEENKTPAYMILSNRNLIDVAAAMPEDINALGDIKGFGSKKIQKYGADILSIIRRHLATVATILCCLMTVLPADAAPMYYGEVLEIDPDNADEELALLKEQGVIVMHHRDELALCMVPMPDSGEPAAIKGKGKRNPGRRSRPGIIPAMNTARNWYDAHLISTGNNLNSPLDGSGVVTGFCDIGFDTRHINFRSADGKECRIRRVVQYMESEGRRIDLTDPEEIYTWHTDNDSQSHATHVAGIMTGAYGADNLHGMAPGSDIVVTVSQLSDAGILAGVEDIIDYARSVDKPAVINISMGNYTGPHDGTSLFARYLDKCGRDAIICISSGNEGVSKNALTVDFTQSQTSADFQIMDNVGLLFDTYGLTDIWMADATPMRFAPMIWDGHGDIQHHVLPTVDFNETPVAVFTSDPDDPDGIYDEKFASIFTGRIYLTGGVDKHNGRFHVEMEYDVHSDIHAPNGAKWARYLIGGRMLAPEGAHADLYTDGQYSTLGTVARVSPKPTTALSISDLATGKNVISVGLYSNINGVNMFNGGVWSSDVEAGKISQYSGYGTLVDGRVLPATSAPGIPVVSSYSGAWLRKYPQNVGRMSFVTDGAYTPAADRITQSGHDSYTEGYYYWGADGGTSMSTPYVAGCIATWLQANPELDVDAVQQIIAATNDREGNAAYDLDPRNGQGWFRPYDALLKVLDFTSKTGPNLYDTQRYISLSGRNLEAANLSAAPAEVCIADMAGNIVARFTAPAGASARYLDSVAPGLYIITIAGGKPLKAAIR